MYEKEINRILTVIKNKRVTMGYSQFYMAEKLGITQNVYSKIEANKIKLTACRLLMICELLDIEAVKLFESIYPVI
ncbi:helix-turn-helix domain-containing protein [Mucilaginibacter sp.]